MSIDGLVREAAIRALDDAGLTWRDIDAMVIGKAPDILEGVMMPELSLADALGAVGKPIHRVHTAGSVGCSTAIVGATCASRAHERVLAVAYEKQSEGNASGPGRAGSPAAWARAARSPRGSGRTSAGRARPSTSAGRSRSRTARTR